MNTITGKREGVPNLQDLLDAVPPDRTIACLPTHESLILHDGEKELGSIPLDGVVDVSLLVDSSIQRRYPIGRSLLLGPLVLLFPKKPFARPIVSVLNGKNRRVSTTSPTSASQDGSWPTTCLTLSKNRLPRKSAGNWRKRHPKPRRGSSSREKNNTNAPPRPLR